jgi:hypothetical protein
LVEYSLDTIPIDVRRGSQRQSLSARDGPFGTIIVYSHALEQLLNLQ